MSSDPNIENIVGILEDHGIRPSRELIASIQKYLDECANDGNFSEYLTNSLDNNLALG